MYQLKGQEFGPISAAKLKRMAEEGTLTSSDKVRPESGQKWIIASKIKGLFPVVPEIDLEHASNRRGDPGVSVEVPPPLPGSITAEPPSIKSQRLPDAPVLAETVELSPSVNALKQVVSDTVWKRLIQLQLPAGDDLFWIRLSAFRARRKESSQDEADAKGFWKRASEKMATFAETAEFPTNRYFVAASDGRYWVTNQLAAVGEAWIVNKEDYDVQCEWQSTELTIELKGDSASVEVELAQFKIDLSQPSMGRFYGSPNRVIDAANTGKIDLPIDDLVSCPLVSRVVSSKSDTFFHSFINEAKLVVVAVSDSAITCADHEQKIITQFCNVVAWRSGDGYVVWITDDGDGIQLVCLATSAAIDMADDATAFVEQIAAVQDAAAVDLPEELLGEESTQAIDVERSSESANTDEYSDYPEAVESPGERGIEHRDLPSRSLDTLLRSLRNHCAHLHCESQMLAAEFDPVPLFGTKSKRLLVLCCDSEVQVLGFDSQDQQWKPLAAPKLYSLSGRWFFESADDELFELSVDASNEQIVFALANTLLTSTPGACSNDRLVLVSPNLELGDSITTALPFRIHFQENGELRFESTDEKQSISSFVCAAGAINKKSRSWNDQFGTATLSVPNRDDPVLLIAPRATLIRVWETRELTSLRTRTQGITLGEMYSLYNQMRTHKFVTGIFGNYFLAQQRLELQSPLDDLIERIELSPSGVLPEQLEMELIERLSILEISRNQLNRWLDRCTLMYPHQQADVTRQWLDEAFGSELVSEETRDQEAWRIHRQTRSELRQVQASMNRAMAEVGQNLGAISFAFPEEVRCAALAATRRAASMAGKGAMVAAFAGVGGQMLMGLGRASIGDPTGIALLGTVGMSMVGRHLEKNAKETEKKIRIRAYGVQGLQWWKVALETASVMALECRHTIEETQKAAMQRDRKLLESLPPEKLPQTQQRMAAVMRKMLH